MERLSAMKRVALVGQYLSGLSYDEIAARGKVSKGTVANVVADLKAGRVPEAADGAEHIELLRELSLDLRRSNLTPGQCATGLTVLTRINECGLDPADIGRWPFILKSAGSEAEAQELVRTIYRVEEVRKKTGLSLEELQDKVDELEKKAADLEPVSRQHEACRKELADLTRKRTGLAQEVAGLEQKYDLLNPRVKDLEKRDQTLSVRSKELETVAKKAETTLAALSKERQGLADIGLSTEALAEFSHRVRSIAQRRGIPPEKLKHRLLQELETLDQTVGLEAIVQSRQKELQEQERAVAAARQEQRSLQASVASLKQEKAALEASIKTTREKVSTEIVKLIPIAEDTINQFEAELLQGSNEALAGVRRLREETLEVGKEIGRYEEIVQANQWLSDLLVLVLGDGTIEGKRVRVILLRILRGLAAWLKNNKAGSLGSSSLLLYTESLIREVEAWKV